MDDQQGGAAVAQHTRSTGRKTHRDLPSEVADGIVAPIAAPRPEDYPDLSPEQRARFEKRWVKNARGLEALRYLAK